MVSYFNAQFTAFRVSTFHDGARTHLSGSNESEQIYDPVRSMSRIHNARRIRQEFLSSLVSRIHITQHSGRRWRRSPRQHRRCCAKDAVELSFIISPGQVGSAGIMQLFRCHNLKSWSIRPRHGRNQQRPGVTGEGRRGWALITDGVRRGCVHRANGKFSL